MLQRSGEALPFPGLAFQAAISLSPAWMVAEPALISDTLWYAAESNISGKFNQLEQ